MSGIVLHLWPDSLSNMLGVSSNTLLFSLNNNANNFCMSLDIPGRTVPINVKAADNQIEAP